MALYDGVPSIRLEGDERRALAAIPEAKVMLQQIQLLLKNSGANTFSMSRSFGDDGHIYVLCTAEQNLIHITVDQSVTAELPPVVTPPPGKPWPDLLSGAVSDGVINSFPVGETTAKLLTSFAPTPNCAFIHDLEIGAQRSHRLSVRPWTAFGEWRAHPPDVRDFSQYQIPRPSWWSGKMKAVVQAVMGFGRINPNSLEQGKFADEVKRDGVQLRFDYKFNRTHGIVTAADGRLWLTEISINRGVIAMPLPVYPGSHLPAFRKHYADKGDTAMVTVLDELRCLPTGEGFPTGDAFNKALDRGDIIRLATAADISAFYQCSGFSSICGWAFSESGHEAHNVGYFYIDMEDPIQRSAWYQINISIGATVEDRRPGQPIASGSASLRKQREGKIYSPPSYDGYTPIYYYEPMLDPPGLLRHSAVPLNNAPPTHPPDCNAPVFVAVIDGQLKLGSFYSAPKLLPPSSTTTLGADECPYNGEWDTYTSQGASIPMMCYTNDVDTRRPCQSQYTHTNLKSRRWGYTGMGVVEFVDAPGWAYLFRSAIFQQTTTFESIYGEQIGAVLVAPSGSREALFMLTGTWYSAHSGFVSTDYRFIRDPNIGYGWSPNLGPRFINTPIGRLDAYTCGQYHPDRRIVGTGVEPQGVAVPCADYADSGPWMELCSPIQNYTHANPFMPNIHSRWDAGRDFSGMATVISAGLSAPVTMPISDSMFGIFNDPPGLTGSSPPTLNCIHSAVGGRTVVYTKFDGTITGAVTDGYMPSGGDVFTQFPCFIGAIHP